VVLDVVGSNPIAHPKVLQLTLYFRTQFRVTTAPDCQAWERSGSRMTAVDEADQG
jgi:hypothetical protein